MDINKALFKFIKIGFTIMIILFVLLATVYLSRTGYDYGYRLFTETAVDEARERISLYRSSREHQTGRLASCWRRKVS